MADGHHFKGYLPGGASGGILPAYMADIPLDFGQLEKHGCFVGSHAVVILSDKDDMKAVALNLMRFFEDESCGQCTPCRNGTEKAVKLMSAGDWDPELLADLSPGDGGCLHLRPRPGRAQPGEVRVQVFPGGPAVSSVIPAVPGQVRSPVRRSSTATSAWRSGAGPAPRDDSGGLGEQLPKPCHGAGRQRAVRSPSGALRRARRPASTCTRWTTWWCRSGNGRLKLVSPAGRGELRRAEAGRLLLPQGRRAPQRHQRQRLRVSPSSRSS